MTHGRSRYGAARRGWALGALLLAGHGSAQEDGDFIPYPFYLLEPPPRGAPLAQPPGGEASTVGPNDPACAQSGFRLPGQAWRTGLTAGGVTLQASRYRNLEPQHEQASLRTAGETLASGGGMTRVRLIVIDHFGLTPIRLKENGAKPQELKVRHGALVIAHMRTLLQDAGYGLTRDKSTPDSLLRYTGGNRTITIQPVNLDDFTTNGVVSGSDTRLAEHLNAVMETIPADEDIIINMSFAIIPCKVFDNYSELRSHFEEANPASRYTFPDYIHQQAALDLARRPVVDDIRRTLSDLPDIAKDFETKFFTRIPDNMLRTWLDDVQTRSRAAGRRVLAVAASGNYGGFTSAQPGAWDHVLSVSATNTRGRPPGSREEGYWSSMGDVSTIGEWFSLSKDQLLELCRSDLLFSCVTGDLLTHEDRYRDFGYRGTSFAAPSVAVSLATQIRPGSCFPRSGTGYGPVDRLGKGRNLPWELLGC